MLTACGLAGLSEAQAEANALKATKMIIEIPELLGLQVQTLTASQPDGLDEDVMPNYPNPS